MDKLNSIGITQPYATSGGHALQKYEGYSITLWDRAMLAKRLVIETIDKYQHAPVKVDTSLSDCFSFNIYNTLALATWPWLKFTGPQW